MKRFSILSLWILALSASFARAQFNDPPDRIPGVGSSGGGFAIVCRSLSDEKITRATLVDLYQVGGDKSIIKSSGDLYQDYMEGLRAYLTLADKEMEIDPQELFRELMASIKFISPPDSLPPIHDLGEEIAVPAGCMLEQIAFYSDEQRKLSVKKDVWNTMDTLNQAALLHHEVIYAQFRKQGEINSKRVRKIVGQIYSESRLSSPLQSSSGN